MPTNRRSGTPYSKPSTSAAFRAERTKKFRVAADAETKAALFLRIAQTHLGSVETLEVRNSDSLDFHQAHVESIVLMLADAYAAGKASK